MKKVNDYLTHWGILGMKWGVRRPVGPDGLVSKLPKKSEKQISDRDYDTEWKWSEEKEKEFKDYVKKEMQKDVSDIDNPELVDLLRMEFEDLKKVGHTDLEKVNDYLTHWGILGMKWGVRRPVGPDGLVADSPYRKQKVSIGDLSDEELKKVILRIEMEKKYSDLTKNNSKLKIGAAIVGGVMVASGKKVAEEYLTKWLKEQAEKAILKGKK